VVYDGLGLEDERQPPHLVVACPSCGAGITVPVAAVLALDPLEAEPEVVEAFGLTTAELGGRSYPVAGLGLVPYGVVGACDSCRERHLAVIGYGEKQPARYMAVYHGVAGVESGADGHPIGAGRTRRVGAAFARACVVALVLTVPTLLGWFHWSVYDDWRRGSRLGAEGVRVAGEVAALWDALPGRSVDGHAVTVRYPVAGSEVVVDRRIEVDAAMYASLESGDAIEVVYDPADPERVDVVGNGVRTETLALLLLTDGVVLVGGGIVLKSARRP
jgi:hypothetical protein